MSSPRLYKIVFVAVLICISAAAMMLIDSFDFRPDPAGDGEFIARAQQKSAPGIRASASALGPRESQRSFGEDLAKYEIQPIWLSIENETDDHLVILEIATDPRYYSPYEVSRKFGGVFSWAANRARDMFFLQRKCRRSCRLVRTRRAFSTECSTPGSNMHISWSLDTTAKNHSILRSLFQDRHLSAQAFVPRPSILARKSWISISRR